MRRVLRRDARDERRWALIGAVWVHLAGAVGLALLPGLPRGEAPPPEVLVELVVLPPEPEAEPIAVVSDAPRPLAESRRGEGWGATDEGVSSVAEVATGPIAAPTHAQVNLTTPEPPTDAVDDLRRSLGWQLDHDLLRERTATLSLVGGPLQTQGAPPDTTWVEPDVIWAPAAGFAGSALGDYVTGLEAAVMARWSRMDLEPHAQALGIQGNVTVRYLVRRSGQTSEVRVVRSSGLPALDGMAVRAIPPRVERIPDALGRAELHHEITLRYRNP